MLETVSEAKYLGVTLTHELSWSTHVNLVATKANRTLGFLRHNLRKCPVILKETAYISMVRSALEYASPIWDPYLHRDCDQLERVQPDSHVVTIAAELMLLKCWPGLAGGP